MTTQLFKAKDVRSAIGMVTEEFGDEAIILSTKKNNGIVEIEASNNNEILTSFPRANEENKAFSKIFLKKLDEKNYKAPQKKLLEKNIKSGVNKNINDIESQNNNDDLKSIKKEILELKKQISGMILTNESNICDKLSSSTPIKLRQDNFSPKLIKLSEELLKTEEVF